MRVGCPSWSSKTTTENLEQRRPWLRVTWIGASNWQASWKRCNGKTHTIAQGSKAQTTLGLKLSPHVPHLWYSVIRYFYMTSDHMGGWTFKLSRTSALSKAFHLGNTASICLKWGLLRTWRCIRSSRNVVLMMSIPLSGQKHHCRGQVLLEKSARYTSQIEEIRRWSWYLAVSLPWEKG